MNTRWVKIIRYFCSVIVLKAFYRTLFVSFFLCFALCSQAQERGADSVVQKLDSVEVSLLTCSPGTEIWSLYGHTAIRIQDKTAQGEMSDIVVNYGVFDFTKPHFVLRFIFGLTDYQMGIVPFQVFLWEYAREGREVVQQRLNLTSDEKAALLHALAVNYQPDNRIYRYNFFYDNCTTRARDMLVGNLDGKVEYQVKPDVNPTHREMVHQWNRVQRWSSFGCDLLLGVGSDRETNFAQQQFLPDTLRKDFDMAVVVDASGKRRPLIDSTVILLKANVANAKPQSDLWKVLTPTVMFLLLTLVVIAFSAYEIRRKKTFWLVDTVLLTLDGLAGLVLLMMIFSQHPTVRLNLQILVLNPLSICFVYGVANQALKGRFHRYWTFLEICIALFAVGGIFQHYAEGMWLLALCLLIRAEVNRHIYTKSQ